MPPRLQALRLLSPLLSRPHPSPIPPLLAPFLLPAHHRSASILSQLSDNRAAYNKKIRRGRGPASGKGKTAGRGQKGQHAHGKVPRDFEGGQTKKAITTPVKGRNKYNPFRVEMSPVNLDRIQSWIDQGRIDPEKPVTMLELKRSRCIHGVRKDGVKLLARNAEQLKTPINIIVSRASAEAIAAVEAAGGTVTTRFYSPTSIKRVLRGESHPTISLQASAELIERSLAPTLSHSPVPVDASPEARASALRSLYENAVSKKYPYRLADATSRKDIEYYRDPAHRGYLAHLVKEGESPSLYFKPPRAVRDAKGMAERRKKAQASADNRLF